MVVVVAVVVLAQAAAAAVVIWDSALGHHQHVQPLVVCPAVAATTIAPVASNPLAFDSAQ